VVDRLFLFTDFVCFYVEQSFAGQWRGEVRASDLSHGYFPLDNGEIIFVEETNQI